MPPRALLLAYGLLVASAAALQAASTFSILDRARTEVLELVGPATVAAPPAVGGVDPDEGCAVIDDRTPEGVRGERRTRAPPWPAWGCA